ncbi:hypothetical protein MY11210_004126 [Beauveria gryllotalpidicola]
MRRTDASLAAMALLAASVQGTRVRNYRLYQRAVLAGLPARASAGADEYSGIVYYGGLSAKLADMGSAEGKFVSGDVIDDFGTLNHYYRFRLLNLVFEDAVIHSNDVLSHTDDYTDDHTDDYTDDHTGDYTDDHTDDYIDNTAHSQLDVDRVQL